MKRQIALSFTTDIIDELNGKFYKLENFENDSKVLMKLLSILDMTHLEDDLDNVREICEKELRKFELSCEDKLTASDKKAILRYL